MLEYRWMSLALGCLALVLLFILICQLLLCIWIRRKYKNRLEGRKRGNMIYTGRRDNIEISPPIPILAPVETPVQQEPPTELATIASSQVEESEYEVPI